MRTDRKGPPEVTVDPSVFARGTVVVGKSGTGKSYDIDLIASQLAEMGVAVVVLDRTGEHAAAAMIMIAATTKASVGELTAKVMTPGKDLTFSVLRPADEGVLDAGEAIEDVLDTLSHYFVVSFEGRPTPLQQRIIRDNLGAYYQGDFRIMEPPHGRRVPRESGAVRGVH